MNLTICVTRDVSYRGEALRIAREAEGFSQGQVAYKLGVSQPMMSYYETGERAVSEDILRRYLDAIGRQDLYSQIAAIPAGKRKEWMTW